MSQFKEYSKGYKAGRRYCEQELADLRREAREKREERVYFDCLGLVLEHCDGWSMGGEKIKDADGFSNLAKIFADNAISRLS